MMQPAVDPSTLREAAEAACRAALRAGLPDVDARDLAQDALVRALGTARPPEGVALPAWVYGIARNLGRDHSRSARRRGVASVPDAFEAATDDDLTTVLAVRRAVNDLPDPLRDVVTLHELEEHTLVDTARALQIPFDTAKDRLRRAREQLRASLADDTTVARERTHSRRRAAAHGAAIVAAVHAALGEQALAAGLVGLSTAAPIVSNAAAPVLGAAGAIGRLASLGLAAGLATALVAGGFVAGRLTAPSRQPAPAEPPAAVASVATPNVDPDPSPAPHASAPLPGRDAPPERDAPAATRGQTAPRPPPAEPAREGSPEAGQAERLLVDRARAGIQRGLAREALVTLMAHERQFPHGRLAEERDVLIIEAYLGAGDAALAERRIAAYRANHSGGVLRSRVDAIAAQLSR